MPINKLIILLLTFSFIASAKDGGNEVGNGGDAVICQTSNKEVSVQLFDFFEYKRLHGEDILEREGNYESINLTILEQLKKHDPKLEKLLSNRIVKFLDNVQFVSETGLTNIKDTNSFIDPLKRECQMEQVAVLKKKVLATEKKFLINQFFWNKLSETHKSGLMFHELIYEYFSDLGEKNSLNARALNSYLFSSSFSKVTTEEYWKMIRSMKVPHYK